MADISVGENTVSARPAAVKVILGDTVRVPLVAVRPNIADRVTFRITEQPKFGSIGEIEPDHADTGRAWVVYTPNADAPAGEDRFKFNAKLDGKPAAPSAQVTITLDDPRPLLQVVPALSFGRIEVGQPTTRPLTIKNRGTGPFAALLQLPAPWSIPQDQRKLVIAPGESVVVDVGFTPVDLKRARFLLLLQPDNPEGNVELSGMGSAPFSRTFGTFELAWDAASGLRKGALHLENLTERQLGLKLTADEPLSVDPGVVLEPRQAIDVPVSHAGIAAFRGKIVITSQHYADTVSVSAKPTPARLDVLEPAGRRFECEILDTEEAPVHEVVVINRGGESAFIYGETSRPFRVVAGGDPAELAAGAKATLKVTLARTEVGTFERAFTILGTANRIQFELSAKVTRNPVQESASVARPDLAPLADAADRKRYSTLPEVQERLFGVSDKNRVIEPAIPTVKEIYLEKQTQRTLVFSWDHPGSADNHYILEVEVHDKGKPGEFPRAVWYAATEHVKVDTDEKGARMTLSDLQPGRSFRMRVFTMNKDGHYSEPSRAYLVYTLPKNSKKRWLLLPLVIALGGGGFYVWRRRQLG